MWRLPGFTVWQHVRESFWFLPAVLCLVAALLAELLVWVGSAGARLDLGPLSPLVYRAGADGSRSVLTAIAGSMLTVAGTTFSITIAVLALTSSTYGPRLVRNFMADRGNQLTLGIFVATFLYALLVLRSIRQVSPADGSGETFVPHLAVNVAVLLALVAVGVLVWFIHHISESIQVWTLSRRVRGELRQSVEHLYPQGLGQDRRDSPRDHGLAPSLTDHGERPGTDVEAREVGYVVDVDEKRLLEVARDVDGVVRLHVRPGQYCIPGTVLAVVQAPDGVSDEAAGSVRAAVTLEDARSPNQDVEFAVQQVLELAVRALSPSTNDPYTAVNALDDVSAELVRLVARDVPSPERYDEEGRLRVVAPAVSRVELVDLVFDSVRAYALAHPLVLDRAVQVAARVGGAAVAPGVRQRLTDQLGLLVSAYAATGPQQVDLDRLRRAAEGVQRELQQ